MATLGKHEMEVLMKVMLPTMFSLFSDMMPNDYKETFKKPCEFNSLLELFAKLPNYFNEMGKLYADKPDLLAYYSMQLASGFLVSNGSLTMDCLFKMLDLQSRLGNFSIDLMDNPEKNSHLIGRFGVAMKPMMSQMKQDPMLKIIEEVDKYDKNNDPYTINLFHRFNIVFVVISIVGILFNLALFLVLKRINNYNKESPIQKLFKNLKRKYKTQSCILIITACHCGYLLINFIIMSQAKLAGLSLGSLNENSFACKVAFTLFAPTSIYNILHQISIWILIYAIFENSKKLRKIKLIDSSLYGIDEDTSTGDYGDYETAMSYYDTHSLTNDNDGFLRRSNKFKSNKNDRSKRNSKIFGCFNVKHKNTVYCLSIIVIIMLYNLPNMLFYTLNRLEYPPSSGSYVTFCAFEPRLSDIFTTLTTKIQPALNLSLFVFIPIIFGGLIILLDICFLIRVYRNDEKRFKKFENNLEITLYVYFFVFALTHSLYAFHTAIDLLRGANKFPFVLPIFIGMTFTKYVGLFITEMLFICIGLSSDFFIWFFADRKFRQLVMYLFKKHILCKSNNLNSSLIVADARPSTNANLISRKRKFDVKEVETSVEQIKHSSTVSTTSTNSTKTLSKSEAVQKIVNLGLIQADKSNKLSEFIDDDTNTIADEIDVNIQQFISNEIKNESFNDYSIPRTYTQKI